MAPNTLFFGEIFISLMKETAGSKEKENREREIDRKKVRGKK